MTDDRDTIRPMRRDEIDLAVEWAAREGWNPGAADAACFSAADAEGFLIGFVDGAPASCISAVRYGGGFAFVGFYIVRPDLRGSGHGLRLWQAAMARIAGRTVGLDGVVAQQDNYRKSGFVLAHRNIRFGGAPAVEAPRDPAIVASSSLPAALLHAYDGACFPAPRPAFLAAWLAAPGHIARACVVDGRVAGYGVVRPCRQGWKIGPLFADDAGIADRLFRALADAAIVGTGATLFLDVPEPHAPAVDLARRYGLAPVFETARMYAGPPPSLPLARQFGITSFELG